MYLRSRNYIHFGIKVIEDTASKISLKESVTQRVGLETIVDDSLEHLSTTSSTSMASKGTNHSCSMSTTIEHNMNLEYHMENPLGAKVYVDPLSIYVVKVDDHEIEFQ